MPTEEPYDLFISYGRGDDIPFTEKLCHDLAQKGYRAWYDQDNLESNGRSFLQNIRDSIALQSKKVLLILGPHAAASEFVKAEWEFALANCMVVIPLVRIGDPDKLMPAPLQKRKVQWIDFRTGVDPEKALDKLLYSLGKGSALGALSGVPNQPANFIAREKDTDKLKAILMKDSYQPGVITGISSSTAVHGMGGIGKSVLAAALCHDCDIRRSFEDGIKWITIGQTPDWQRAVQQITGDDTIAFGDRIEEGRDKLNLFLQKKRCLLVLDDVWRQSDIAIFPSDERLLSRMLITTRNKSTVELLNGNIVEIGLLDDTEARLLLFKTATFHHPDSPFKTPGDLPAEADAIIRQCGNLPLALAMAGGMVSNGDRDKWRLVLECLEKADLKEISKKFPDYPYPNLYRVLDASIGFLAQEGIADPDNKALFHAKEKYLELCIFPEDTVIPKPILLLLWMDVEFREIHADNLLDILVERSLLTRTKQGDYTLHDLQVDYLKRTNASPTLIHKKFLQKAGDPLALAHPYLWTNYIRHLLAAGEVETAGRLLLDFEWIKEKLSAAGIYELLNDYKLLPEEEATGLLYGALKLSAQVLSTDKEQLLPQLWGRLGNFADSRIKQLLDKAFSRTTTPWLRSLLPSLAAPGKNENILKFDTPVHTFMLKENTVWLPDAYSSVYTYDLKDYRLQRKFVTGSAGKDYDAINHIFPCRDQLIMVSSKGGIYRYDPRNDSFKVLAKEVPGGVDKVILYRNKLFLTNYTNDLVLIPLDSDTPVQNKFVNAPLREAAKASATEVWREINAKSPDYKLQDHLENAINTAVTVTAIAPFGDHIAFGYRWGQISMFHITEQKWFYSFPDEWDDAIAILLPWRNSLLSVHFKGKIYCWEKDGDSFSRTLYGDLALEITYAYADNDWLYVGGYEGDVVIFHLSAKKQVKSRVHEHRVAWLSGQDNRIISISEKNAVNLALFDGHSLRPDGSSQLPAYFGKAVIEQDTLFLLSSDYKMRILEWASLKTGSPGEKVFHGSLDRLATIGNSIIAFFGNSSMEWRQLQTGRKLPVPSIIPEGESISAAEAIGESFFVATGTGNLYETRGDGQTIRYKRTLYSQGNLEIEQIAADEKYVYTGSNGGEFAVWRRDGKSHIRTLYKHGDRIYHIYVYKHFVVSTTQRDHYCWNTGTEKGIRAPLPHRHFRGITTDAGIIVCGYADGMVSAYDIEKNDQQIFRLTDADITCISRVGDRWYAGAKDGSVFCTAAIDGLWDEIVIANSAAGEVKKIYKMEERLVIIRQKCVTILPLAPGTLAPPDICFDYIAESRPLNEKLLVFDMYSALYILDLKKNDGNNIVCRYKPDTYPTSPILFRDNKVIFGDHEGHLHLLEPVGFDW